MYRTLFFIPHEFAGIPVFGFGWLFALVVLYGMVTTALAVRRRDSHRASEMTSNLGVCISGALLIALVFPYVEIKDQAGNPIGMAIRGYGLMMLVGVVSAVLIAAVRAKRHNISAETIFAAAPWLFVLGILGARIFYVVEYYDRFESTSLSAMLQAILDFTRGGIVVYGALIGGFVGLVIFCRRHQLSFFRMADIIVPCVFIGLCLGRIGCLMNGCCYGGRCEPGGLALNFPKGSPVYEEQLRDGDLLGLEIAWDVDANNADANDGVASRGTIQTVRPASLAAAAGLKAGQQVRLTLQNPPKSERDLTLPVDDTSQIGIEVDADGTAYRWTATELPERALPVAPAQIYSSAAGLFVAVFLMVISNWVRHEGVLLGVGFAAYAVIRFGLESIRSDEPGQFGTSLTISQWVSIGVLLASVALIVNRTMAAQGQAEADMLEPKSPGKA